MATSLVPKITKKDVTDSWKAEADAHQLYVALFLSTSNCETQTLYSTCTNQVAGGVGGYVTGGKELVATSAYDGENAVLGGTNLAWTTASFTFRYTVVYNTVTSKIRGIFAEAVDRIVTGGTITVQWNPSGLIKVS